MDPSRNKEGPEKIREAVSGQKEPQRDRDEVFEQQGAEEISAGVPKKGAERVPADVPEEGAEGVPGNVPGEGAERVPSGVPKKGAERVPSGIPEEGAEGVPGNVPEEGAEGVPGNVPGEGAKGVPAGVPGEGSEGVPAEVPEEREAPAFAAGEDNPPFMRCIGEVWRCANLYRTARYEGTELGSYQDTYIVHVCRTPGITQEQLAGKIYVHKSNVARQLSALEEKGFVERRPDPDDRRSLRIFPTRRALDILPLILEVRRAWSEAVLAGLDRTERAGLEAALSRLAGNAKRVLEGEGGREGR